LQGLWQKKIKPELLEKMEPREIKRQEAIHEVIESEAFYLKDLALTYRVNNNNRKKERSLV